MKSFRMMYSNIGLSFREILPLNKLSVRSVLSWSADENSTHLLESSETTENEIGIFDGYLLHVDLHM